MMKVKTENLKVKDIDNFSKDFSLSCPAVTTRRRFPSPFSISFSYDGWNQIAEFCTGDTTSTNYFAWGLDLSGSMQGAGGIGGLLSTIQDEDVYFSFFDANGNVTDYVDETGDIVAHYEYNPFGGITSATGDKKDDFNFRFSTKYLDTETGLYYYGYRYYTPPLGRFVNKDPIGERGGLNVYGFVLNNTVSDFDLLGLLTPTTAEKVVSYYLVSKSRVPGLQSGAEEASDANCSDHYLNKLRNDELVGNLEDISLSLAFSPLKLLSGSLLGKLSIQSMEAVISALMKKGVNEDEIVDLMTQTAGNLEPWEIQKLHEVAAEFLKMSIGKGVGDGRLVTRASGGGLMSNQLTCRFFVTAETSHPIGRVGMETFSKGNKFTLFITCEYECTHGKYENCPCGCEGDFIMNVSGEHGGYASNPKNVEERVE